MGDVVVCPNIPQVHAGSIIPQDASVTVTQAGHGPNKCLTGFLAQLHLFVFHYSHVLAAGHGLKEFPAIFFSYRGICAECLAVVPAFGLSFTFKSQQGLLDGVVGVLDKGSPFRVEGLRGFYQSGNSLAHSVIVGCSDDVAELPSPELCHGDRVFKSFDVSPLGIRQRNNLLSNLLLGFCFLGGLLKCPSLCFQAGILVEQY